MIQGLIVLNIDTYSFARWHGTLLFYAVFLLSLFINTYLARLLPQFESVVLVIHIIGFFCILIPLAYLAPHGSAADVFQKLENGGGWSTDGLSFLIGLSSSQYALLGVDAASHMGEFFKVEAKILQLMASSGRDPRCLKSDTSQYAHIRSNQRDPWVLDDGGDFVRSRG